MTSVLQSSSAMPAAAEAKAPLSTTHPFTCNTCQVAFRSSEQQRTHMHTDWHRYNLKRRITSLPPLPSEVFAEKVLHMQATTRLERERASFEKQCRPCGKTYYSENAYSNHIGSLKHRQSVAATAMGMRPVCKAGVVGSQVDPDEVRSQAESTFSFGDPIPITGDKTNEGAKVDAAPTAADVKRNDAAMKLENEAADKEFASVISKLKLSPSNDLPTTSPAPKEDNLNTPKSPSMTTEPKSILITECLFCNYMSPSLSLNVTHMFKAHGLFIPEQSYIADLEGLIGYLGEKVAIGYQCLWCNKQKGGIEAIRTHMRDKGHCKIAFESEEEQLELGDFYDFRATYEDLNDENLSDDDADFREEVLSKSRKRGGIKSNKRTGESEFVAEGDTAGGEEGEGWETDSSASSLDSTELCAVPRERHHSPDGSLPKHHKEDGWHSHAHTHAHTHATAVYHTDYELHLPSGRSVGHRSLARYYRQKLSHPLSARVSAVSHTRYPGYRLKRIPGLDPANKNGDEEEVEEFDGEEGGSAEAGDEDTNRDLTRRERRDLMFRRSAEEDVMFRRRGPVERGTGTLTTRGLAGMTGVDRARRREVVDEEKRGRRVGEREQRRYQWGKDKRGNMQKHYRDPLLQ